MKKFMTLFLTMALIASMSLTGVAANFTPSVQGKPAPEVVTNVVTTPDGKKQSYVAQVIDKEGKVIKNIEKDSVVITPVSKSKKATPEVKAALDKAYKQIKDAKSLKDLVPDIETHLKSLSKTLKVEDMVTRDLFNISVNKETEQYLKNGNSIKLSFQLGVKPNTKVVCMTLVDGKWTVIDQSKVKVNKDGTVTVEFTSAGLRGICSTENKNGCKDSEQSIPLLVSRNKIEKVWRIMDATGSRKKEQCQKDSCSGCSFASLLGVIGAVSFWEAGQEKEAMSVQAEIDESARRRREGWIERDGVSYAPKQGQETMLLIGLDKMDPLKQSEGYNNNTQADFLLLAVFDDIERKSPCPSYQPRQYGRNSCVGCRWSAGR